jgi:hypothetical protein
MTLDTTGDDRHTRPSLIVPRPHPQALKSFSHDCLPPSLVSHLSSLAPRWSRLRDQAGSLHLTVATLFLHPLAPRPLGQANAHNVHILTPLPLAPWVRLMHNVQEFIDSPGERDIEVQEIFTNDMWIEVSPPPRHHIALPCRGRGRFGRNIFRPITRFFLSILLALCPPLCPHSPHLAPRPRILNIQPPRTVEE